MKKFLMTAMALLALVACKEKPSDYEFAYEILYDDDGNYWIVEKEEMRVVTGNPVSAVADSTSADVINVDTSQLVTPLPSGGVLELGTLKINSLADSDLNHCGPAKNERCGTAIIRIYTTMPTGGFEVAKAGGAYKKIGVGSKRATVLEKLAIPAGQSQLRITDYVLGSYQVRMNAGAQAYDTDLVIEYALAP